VRGVAGEEDAASAPLVGDNAVERVDDRSLDLGGGDLAVRAEQLGDQLVVGPFSGGALPREEQELVPAPAVLAGDDYGRPLGDADVHPVHLPVWVVEGIGDQPGFIVGPAVHRDAEALADGGPPAVGTDDIPRGHRMGAADGGDAHGHAAVAYVEPGYPGAEAHLDERVRVEYASQDAFQVRLGERVLERVAEPIGLGAPGMEEGLAVAAEVPRAGAGRDNAQHLGDDPGVGIGTQALVIDADRLRVRAGRRVRLKHHDLDIPGGEQRRGGHPDGARPDDDDIRHASLHMRSRVSCLSGQMKRNTGQALVATSQLMLMSRIAGIWSW
jgi:hypothetical protein